MALMIITKKEWDVILKQRSNEPFMLKVDFGLKEVKALRALDKVIIDNSITISLSEKVKENFCYAVEDNKIWPIAFFSETTNRFYKLTPTNDWPTISIGSVPMHKLDSPKNDTQSKVNLLKPYGVTLDTCMGPGYSATMSAKSAKKVITFEKDENVLEVAKLNPLSSGLFSKEANIEVRMEDISEAIKGFPDECFDCILHDPPTFKLAPELFTKEFYSQLFRVLKKKGRLFHYTPLYKISQGYDFPSKIKKNLQISKFTILEFSDKAGGILCKK